MTVSGGANMFLITDDHLETQWANGLVISDGIEITEIDDDDINHQLAAIYELTYKYDQIDMHEWSGTGEKSQVLAICEAGVRDVAGRLAEMLDEVFAHWLELHAITEPKRWARARVTMNDETGDGDHIQGAISEYVNLGSKNDRGSIKSLRRWWRNVFFKELEKKADGLKVLKRIAKPFLDDLYTMDMEEWKSGNLDQKPTRSETRDIFDYDFEEFVSGLAPDDRRDLAVELYEVMVFPAWYGQWRDRGIDATRRRVEKSYEQIQKIQKSPKSFEVRDLASEVNKIIQTTHQTGPMVDYVVQQYDLEEHLLNYLSEGLDTDLFDLTLTAMGVDLGSVDSSAIARRRQRDDAAKIVRAAWEDLAEEQSGRRNPRVSLQEAVIRFIAG